MSKSYDYDVIVVGSGMSGGWAAKEFCEKGYKTLVLDRGKPLEHGKYKTEGIPPWDMPNRGFENQGDADRDHAINQKCYAFSEYTRDYFINDRENPYDWVEGQPFDWIRSAHIGGKSLLWGRQVDRFSEMDFAANQEDGTAIDWPVRYRDIEPWYAYVERFIGVSGAPENLPQLPDQVFQKPLEMNAVEKQVKKNIEARFPSRKMIMGRCAHLTEPTKEQLALGRGQCLSRSECYKGCSWGGYFSSLSATLPAAKRTGNLTLQANSTVHSVTYDPQSGRASGVKVIETTTKQVREITGRIIFLCASTLASTQILLNSRSARYANGIGNTSGVLGHYLMDHLYGIGASGRMEGYEQHFEKGRRPSAVYIPRFANVTEPYKHFNRGFYFQGIAKSARWRDYFTRQGIGVNFKESIRTPGEWRFFLEGFGEMLPNYNNRVYLDHSRHDANGMPILVIDCKHGKNETAMKKAMQSAAGELLTSAGAKDIQTYDSNENPGLCIHEVGTARMGDDPGQSYLNKYNQSHEVPNLFVTDGSSFTSSPCQNPSLTFMALTARAADYADEQMKKGNI